MQFSELIVNKRAMRPDIISAVSARKREGGKLPGNAEAKPIVAALPNPSRDGADEFGHLTYGRNIPELR
ncbi:MAG: hypothetical protein Q7K33_00865 [Candidatus Berkelbacteria bacterium]|nr:hypothetical protein [Candidatus Berkelbacteria bacterium]